MFRDTLSRIHILPLLAVSALVLGACAGSSGHDADATRVGARLYSANCQTCHGEAATGVGSIAPAPSHGPDGHTWHHADGQLVDIVLGTLDYPGRIMPRFAGQLTADEVQVILAYLKTNWSEEQKSFQEETSRNWAALSR